MRERTWRVRRTRLTRVHCRDGMGGTKVVLAASVDPRNVVLLCRRTLAGTWPASILHFGRESRWHILPSKLSK